jgi:hypothetical protein
MQYANLEGEGGAAGEELLTEEERLTAHTRARSFNFNEDGSIALKRRATGEGEMPDAMVEGAAEGAAQQAGAAAAPAQAIVFGAVPVAAVAGGAAAAVEAAPAAAEAAPASNPEFDNAMDDL